ncbi:transcription factor rlmA isoform X2 [Pyrus x bretschneideri]|uniref:transcription factor rlmA isoform X2 n=1 Tax=Pyrus x bretschneideri TaxID=225117 RepID=UPI002030EF6E|nr:transcription factor rlmA isoform X2 [Pyrus x bretschneideri]
MASDQEIAEGVETVLRQSGPNDIASVNGVVQQLEAKLGLDLSHKAGFIRDQINFLLRPYAQLPQPQPPKAHFALHYNPNPQSHHPHNQHPQFLPQQFPPQFALHSHHLATEPHSFHPPPPPHQQLRAQPQSQPQPQPQPLPVKTEAFPQNAPTSAPETPKESAPSSGTKRRGGPGGLNKVCGVSPELEAVVGEPALPRTEIVKQLWAYIRKNNLQDPSNKRKIICDDALRVVFETDCTDMFKMNKLLSKHIIPLGPNKEPSQAKRLKVEAKSTTESTQPQPQPQAQPQPQPQPGSPTVGISEALANFLGFGGREMLLSEARRLVWEYVKVNRLEVRRTFVTCSLLIHRKDRKEHFFISVFSSFSSSLFVH